MSDYLLGGGRSLSEFQDVLATWYADESFGPDKLYDNHVSRMPREILEDLVMANVGKRAQDLEQA